MLRTFATQGDCEPMSKLYTDAHRRLQDEFDTRRMADRIEEVGASDTVDDEQKALTT